MKNFFILIGILAFMFFVYGMTIEILDKKESIEYYHLLEKTADCKMKF